MAVSKRAEKERLKKERISKVGKELLAEEMKKPSLQERITAATLPQQDGDKWYKSKDIGKPRSQIAKEIIRSDNRSLKGGNATERMENDTRSMGYKAVEKKWYEKPILWMDSPNLDAGNERRLKRMYGDVEGQKKINEENNRRQESNFNARYKTVLRNEWENPMYGISEKDKQKMMKKKGKK